MDSKSERLEQNEVISVKNPSERILMPHTTFKANEFITIVRNQFVRNDQPAREWFHDGIECEILTPGKNWRTGKVRFSLEFLPDEPEIEETPTTNEIIPPESPLDDLRQMMNQENS